MQKIKKSYYKFNNFNKSLIFITLVLILLNFSFKVFAFNETLNSNLLILVNKTYTISKDYIPIELYNIGEFMPITKNQVLVRKEVYDALKVMYNDLKSDGLELNGVSGYRDYEYQENLFINEVKAYKNMGYSEEKSKEMAKTMVAPPGSSEHQTGLAVDFSTGYTLSENFGNEEVGVWLQENCAKYGFILRYAENKTDITDIIYEPWHFRFVGLPHSIYITENDLTLEEYIDLISQDEHIIVKYGNDKYDIFYTNNLNDNYNNILDISYDNYGGYIVTTKFTFGELLTRVMNAYLKKGVLNR